MSAVVATPSASAPKVIRVLYADDQDMNRMVMRGLTLPKRLQQLLFHNQPMDRNYTIQLTLVDRGRLAIDQFIDAGADIVLLDHNMAFIDEQTGKSELLTGCQTAQIIWELVHPATPFTSVDQKRAFARAKIDRFEEDNRRTQDEKRIIAVSEKEEKKENVGTSTHSSAFHHPSFATAATAAFTRSTSLQSAPDLTPMAAAASMPRSSASAYPSSATPTSPTPSFTTSVMSSPGAGAMTPRNSSIYAVRPTPLNIELSTYQIPDPAREFPRPPGMTEKPAIVLFSSDAEDLRQESQDSHCDACIDKPTTDALAKILTAALHACPDLFQ